MSDLFETITLLKQSRVFSDVPTDSLRAVAELVEEEQYTAGDRVYNYDDAGTYIYLVKDGRIGLSAEASDSQHEYAAEIKPGECFGDINLLDALPRTATACAVEDSVVLSLQKSELFDLILSNPEMSTGLLKGMSRQLRQAYRNASMNQVNQ